jgi:hypothetical protein
VEGTVMSSYCLPSPVQCSMTQGMSLTGSVVSDVELCDTLGV